MYIQITTHRQTFYMCTHYTSTQSLVLAFFFQFTNPGSLYPSFVVEHLYSIRIRVCKSYSNLSNSFRRLFVMVIFMIFFIQVPTAIIFSTFGGPITFFESIRSRQHNTPILGLKKTSYTKNTVNGFNINRTERFVQNVQTLRKVV